ncbi:hypothetical protein BRC81_16875 [Halobacteriales archaeon QS_1_68_20]|nr:MAG: hypothetical protein BRC81_16875 [Halobacteriales archaeon QS_1_68_20]
MGAERPRRRLRGSHEADENAFLVAVRDDESTSDEANRPGDAGPVVAFGSLTFAAPEDYEAEADAEVTGVYVHPEAASQGVGSAVLADLERRARAGGVATLGLSASLNAVAFYEDHGYERVRAYVHEFSAAASTGVEGTVVEMRKDL